MSEISINYALRDAALHGRAATVQFVLHRHPELSPVDIIEIACQTAQVGQVETLALLVEAARRLTSVIPDAIPVAAIRARNIASLRELRKLGWTPTWRHAAEAAAADRPEVLRYLHGECGCPWDGVEWGERTAEYAAGVGSLECLSYAIAHGARIDAWTTSRAARAGQLQALKLLRLHGCPWDEYTTRSAYLGGHDACLRYALDNGCPAAAVCGVSPVQWSASDWIDPVD